MVLLRIIDHCHTYGLDTLKIESTDFAKLKDKLTGEHYEKLQKIQQHDNDLELAIASLSEEAFYKLILLELDETRALTANGRSLKEVGDFMVSQGIKSTELFNGSGWLDKAWSINVYEYYARFDYDKFGYLLVAPPLPNELEKTKDGCWYLADGNHRALALLAKLKLDNFGYKPINVVFTYFNRHDLAKRGITI